MPQSHQHTKISQRIHVLFYNLSEAFPMGRDKLCFNVLVAEVG